MSDKVDPALQAAVKYVIDRAINEGLPAKFLAAHPTITTVAELHALPVGSVVVESNLDEQGHGAIGKQYDGWVCISHASQNLPAEDIMLPATVIYLGASKDSEE